MTITMRMMMMFLLARAIRVRARMEVITMRPVMTSQQAKREGGGGIALVIERETLLLGF